MYKTIAGIAAIAIFITIVAIYIYQSPQYTTIQEEERAVFLAEKALNEYYKKGSDSFESIINDPSLHDDNVYVFVVDKNTGIIMAHSIDKNLVGQDVTKLMNIDGVRIGTSILESATTAGMWIEYKWENPKDGDISYKKLWVKLFEGHIFGATDIY